MPAVTQIAGLLVIAAAVVAIARRVDVRLALLLAAFAMGGLAGDVGPDRSHIFRNADQRAVRPADLHGDGVCPRPAAVRL